MRKRARDIYLDHKCQKWNWKIYPKPGVIVYTQPALERLKFKASLQHSLTPLENQTEQKINKRSHSKLWERTELTEYCRSLRILFVFSYPLKHWNQHSERLRAGECSFQSMFCSDINTKHITQNRLLKIWLDWCKHINVKSKVNIDERET